MSEELSILSLVLQAGPVVQLVMATLVLASVFSWVVIFQRTRVLSRAQKHARLFEDTFWSGAELVGLYKQVANSPNLIGLEAVFKAGFQEFTRLRQDVKSDPDAVMEGVHRAMRVARAKEEERLRCPFAVSGNGRLHQPVHRSLRDGLGDHELLPRFGCSEAGDPCNCRSGDLGGFGGNSDWIICSDSCSYRLQPVYRQGG